MFDFDSKSKKDIALLSSVLYENVLFGSQFLLKFDIFAICWVEMTCTVNHYNDNINRMWKYVHDGFAGNTKYLNLHLTKIWMCN